MIGAWKSWWWAFCVAAVILSSCATAPPLVLQTIGPDPQFGSRGKEGALQVFTATQTVPVGGMDYYPHTGYRIYTPEGKFFRYVRNNAGVTDQSPTAVKLPVGNYYLTAMSEGFGVVKVPFQVKGSQMTFIVLDNSRLQDLAGAKDDQVVRMPNNRVAGWRAALSGD
jgi:hypothetical protein